MKSIVTVMVVVFVAVLLALGSGSVKAASTGAMAKCEQQFKSLDVGNRGYLAPEQIHEGMYGHAHKGLGPTGKGDSVFTSMDTNKDNKVTLEEFCAWKTR
jgi:hypothetical protein